MDICKTHFLNLALAMQLNYIENDTNRDATIEVGDTYTIVAEIPGLSAPCIDCAYDAGELIYSDEWEQACHRGKELAHPVEWTSGFNVTTGYYNGHVAKAQVQAASLQEALESTKDFWDDPQFQSMKITRAIMGREEE
jgi:hypothetical protein